MHYAYMFMCMLVSKYKLLHAHVASCLQHCAFSISLYICLFHLMHQEPAFCLLADKCPSFTKKWLMANFIFFLFLLSFWSSNPTIGWLVKKMLILHTKVIETIANFSSKFCHDLILDTFCMLELDKVHSLVNCEHNYNLECVLLIAFCISKISLHPVQFFGSTTSVAGFTKVTCASRISTFFWLII